MSQVALETSVVMKVKGSLIDKDLKNKFTSNHYFWGCLYQYFFEQDRTKQQKRQVKKFLIDDFLGQIRQCCLHYSNKDVLCFNKLTFL